MAFANRLSDRLQAFLAASLLVLSLLVPSWLMAGDEREWTRLAVERLCPLEELSGLSAQLELPGSWFLTEEHVPDGTLPRRSSIRLALSDANELLVERRAIGGQLRQFRTELHVRDGTTFQPRFQAIADGGCVIRSARAIRHGHSPWIYLDQIDGDLTTLRWSETLQAPWPDGIDPGGVRVALVDTGLSYDLPVFRHRLARDDEGQPLGYDFWDLDPWPYDGDVSRGAFFPIRHGTTVASILAREAPDAALVPYRFPRPSMHRMGDLVARAASAGVRVLAMPLGSHSARDWDTFVQAMAQHDLLLIVSAGNDGRNIDQAPLYPAVLEIENMVVVTSSDDFGRLANGSNWGPESVDIMLPAENLDVIDFRGASGVASGSSYAVPRLAAMAARILHREPGLTAGELKQRLFERAKPSPFERSGVTSAGWIADPLAD